MMKPSLVDCSVRGLSTLPGRSLRLAASADGQRRNFYNARHGSSRPATSKDKSTFCSRTSSWLLSTFAPTLAAVGSARQQTQRHIRSPACARSFVKDNAAPAESASGSTGVAPLNDAQDKDQLLSLVGDADVGRVDGLFDFHRDPYRRGYANPENAMVQVSDNTRDVEYPSQEETFKPSPETSQILGKLKLCLLRRRRQPHRITLDAIYKLYNQLPEPRMLQITATWRSMLLTAMGLPRTRSSETMMQYFTLVADVKSAGLTLTRTQWNYAVAFAAKYTSRATTREMESTMRLWREMERAADIKGNEVTFNLLFEVSAKAGNFALAEMIYKEMYCRGIEFNRFHHVTLIHYFGLRLDSGGVRAAYKEMVEAGEIIDTVTLNAVIAGLLRCGEEDAADETYQRMRQTLPAFGETPKPPKDYSTQKAITKTLLMFSKLGKRFPSMRAQFQKGVDITPDLRTYKLLIGHYAVRLGSMKKTAQYLDEMKEAGVRAHPTIFLAIFKGFTAHGGFPGSEWNEERLQGVLSALFQAHKEAPSDFVIGHWLVLWALRAVQRCGSSESIVETFQLLSECWTIPEDRVPVTESFFASILEGKDSHTAQRALARDSRS